jgi:hypothetical protein
MPAEPNVTGMARLLYVVAGAAVAAWGIWGASAGWTQWTWLTLGGIVMVLGLIGYSPIHSVLLNKTPKAS